MDRAEVEKAVLEVAQGRQFRQPGDPEEGSTDISVSYDVAIASLDDSKLVLDVTVWVDCEEYDQESAVILSQEQWWSAIAGELEKRLGLEVQTGKFDMSW